MTEGLYTGRDLLQFARQIGAAAVLGSLTPSGKGADEDVSNFFNSHVRPIRYTARGKSVSGRMEADSAVFPCAYQQTPVLQGMKLCRVVDHRGLFRLLLPSNPFWKRVEDQSWTKGRSIRHKTEAEVSDICAALGSIPESLRRFRLVPNDALTYGVVWFTAESSLPFAWESPPSPDLAARARDGLGLVHLPAKRELQPTHLFCLRLDGRIADHVGHYRPTALDGMENRRFMVPTNVPSGIAGPQWGWTADLAMIDQAARPMTGAMERVSNQIVDTDFEPDETIEFSYLGELTSSHAIADSLFASRL